jgi:hypothetical protein
MNITPKDIETDPDGRSPPPFNNVCCCMKKTINSGQTLVGQLHFTIVPVSETKPANALTFDFTTIEGNCNDFVREIVKFYQNKILSIKYIHRERMIQLDFVSDIDVAEVIHDGFFITVK